MKLLHIDSSILNKQSLSRRLTAQVVEHYQTLEPNLEVTHYDLESNPIAYLSGASFSDAQEQETGARVLNDFLAADVLVIGAPMYNFSIPAQLKAWVDRIAVAGKTFRYTENGPEGLASGKKVAIVSTRGGIYSGEMSFMDHQESYLKNVFAFLGIDADDVEIIRAEGVNINPETAAAAVANAQSAIPALH